MIITLVVLSCFFSISGKICTNQQKLDVLIGKVHHWADGINGLEPKRLQILWYSKRTEELVQEGMCRF